MIDSPPNTNPMSQLRIRQMYYRQHNRCYNPPHPILPFRLPPCQLPLLSNRLTISSILQWFLRSQPPQYSPRQLPLFPLHHLLLNRIPHQFLRWHLHFPGSQLILPHYPPLFHQLPPTWMHQFICNLRSRYRHPSHSHRSSHSHSHSHKSKPNHEHKFKVKINHYFPR